jgi:hypothetical protein
LAIERVTGQLVQARSLRTMLFIRLGRQSNTFGVSKLLQLLQGAGMVVDHLLRKRADLIVGALALSQSSCFDFSQVCIGQLAHKLAV